MRGDDEDDLSGPFEGPLSKTMMGKILSGGGKDGPDKDIERLKTAQIIEGIVSKRYIVLDRRYDRSGVFLRVAVDPKDNEKSFEDIRKALKKRGMFPRLVESKGEYYVVVFPLPKKKRKRSKTRTNLIMLVLTVITTVWAGAILWESRSGSPDSFLSIFKVIIKPEEMLMGGLTFAFPLLLILGTHELGHYFTSRRYEIDASLPYFIPIPPFISPFGTFGALISMKEPLSNRKALVDIGAAGPISGFIVAIPVTILGLLLTDWYPTSNSLIEGALYIQINPPLLFRGLMSILGVSEEGSLYPTAIAGWIGLFVTALNLFPVGQLDGGHIARGALGDKAKYLSLATISTMLILGFITGFFTYILFAILILLLGSRHPPPLDDISPLSGRQYATVGLSVVIMVLTFHPVPIEEFEFKDQGVEVLEHEMEEFVSSEVPNEVGITVLNDGNNNKNVTMSLRINGSGIRPSLTERSFDWNRTAFGEFSSNAHSSFKGEGWYILSMGALSRDVAPGRKETFTIILGASREKPIGSRVYMEVGFETSSGKRTTTEIELHMAPACLKVEELRGQGNISHILNGTVHVFGGKNGTTNLSLRAYRSPVELNVSFEPGMGDGIWSETTLSAYDHIRMREDDVFTLGLVRWPQVNRSARIGFTLNVTPVSPPADYSIRLDLRIEGPDEIRTHKRILLKWPKK